MPSTFSCWLSLPIYFSHLTPTTHFHTSFSFLLFLYCYPSTSIGVSIPFAQHISRRHTLHTSRGKSYSYFPCFFSLWPIKQKHVFIMAYTHRKYVFVSLHLKKNRNIFLLWIVKFHPTIKHKHTLLFIINSKNMIPLRLFCIKN